VLSVELKYKEQKIRDLFVYHTSVYPIRIDIKRHELIIYVKEHEFNTIVENFGIKSKGEKFCNDLMTKLIGRKTMIKFVA
jgi:hypothetical protein